MKKITENFNTLFFKNGTILRKHLSDYFNVAPKGIF